VLNIYLIAVHSPEMDLGPWDIFHPRPGQHQSQRRAQEQFAIILFAGLGSCRTQCIQCPGVLVTSEFGE
jgi:hypothetical protein